MTESCAALTPLAALDPDLARRLKAACRRASPPPRTTDCQAVVDTLLECFGREINFGQAVAEGYAVLLASGPPGALAVYGAAVRRDGRHGAGLGRTTALNLPSVLLADDASLLTAYRRSVAVLLSKGAYLLPAPLEGLRWLLAKADRPAAAEYLGLLRAVFDRKLSYNRCQYLGNLLPRALRRMPEGRRCGQLQQLRRVARADLRLLEPFLEGLERGLNLLADQALERFGDQALALASRHFEQGLRFMALRSETAHERCRALQTAVPLTRVTVGLNRYLQARIGHSTGLKPLSALPGIKDEALVGGPRAACDGSTVFLPEEIDHYPSHKANARLFRIMAKFETALIEYATFQFDLERARDLGLSVVAPPPASDDPPAVAADLAWFVAGFDYPPLALDLLTLFEHARLNVRLQIDYPGLVREGRPVFQAEFGERRDSAHPPPFLDAAYACLALGLSLIDMAFETPAEPGLLADMQAAFRAADPARMPVEASAGLVITFYPLVAQALAVGRRPYRPLTPPFRLALPVDAHARALAPEAHQAAVIAHHLAASGFKLYPADLRMLLKRNSGRLDGEDVRALLRQARRTDRANGPEPAALETLDPSDWQLTSTVGVEAALEDPEDVENVVWLQEWHHLIGDYLHDHVRVRDRRLPSAANGFYTAVLERHQGLVRRLKYAFELLRPEGLQLLRQWIEGDDFDYRALLDYALDRRAGVMPSERLYIKRIKQRRDVAVLLLVDLSRSTSNIVAGSDASSVLDVEKEAIVLFSQALEVVGDRYAIAGFSGTGRLGVDYFRIKDFDAALDEVVRGGIGQLRPQRSTRMGAAVRRATRDLLEMEARVRLLIVIGDGFPNDLEYKQDYAIADTRQAIGEARARQVYTHAITVNIPASPRLDDLFGHVHHTVISDVRELPDQLLRIYSTLTRS